MRGHPFMNCVCVEACGQRKRYSGLCGRPCFLYIELISWQSKPILSNEWQLEVQSNCIDEV
jgi:hypothetical protein